MKALRRAVVKRLETWVAQSSLVGNTTFFSVEQFSWATQLEANWLVIRKELEQVLEYVDELPNFQDISPRQHRIANDDRWKTYFFFAFGFKATKNCERCPETTKLLEQIPGMKVAFFSILAPGKHIPEHRGKHIGIIRYHLGLMVPEPKTDCWLCINDEVAYWEEGKSLIFDDTFLHEVWNNTNGYRVVLFLDVLRPLRFPVSAVNWLACKLIAASPIIQVAKANHENWEKRFAEVMKENQPRSSEVQNI